MSARPLSAWVDQFWENCYCFPSPFLGSRAVKIFNQKKVLFFDPKLSHLSLLAMEGIVLINVFTFLPCLSRRTHEFMSFESAAAGSGGL